MRHRIAMAAALTLVWLAGTIHAQELEPGVQTSSAAAAVQRGQPPAAAPQAPTQKPAAGPPAKPAPGGSTISATTANATTAHGKSGDRIQLDTTQISGNRELPKVMYVVPWRRADPGDFAGRPPNSLLDEALTPLDRDIFKRQNRYYGVLQEQAQSSKSQAGTTGATADPSTPKDEK